MKCLQLLQLEGQNFQFQTLTDPRAKLDWQMKAGDERGESWTFRSHVYPTASPPWLLAMEGSLLDWLRQSKYKRRSQNWKHQMASLQGRRDLGSNLTGLESNGTPAAKVSSALQSCQMLSQFSLAWPFQSVSTTYKSAKNLLWVWPQKFSQVFSLMFRIKPMGPLDESPNLKTSSPLIEPKIEAANLMAEILAPHRGSYFA